MTTCAWGGKVAYGSENAAKHARQTLSDRVGKKNLRIYKCPNCYSYHLTSRPQ